ncbi:MAG TPA: LysM peptidoglycan-binding domain-containing protein [Gemmatimonadaceae bacterium]|nr:LysM peptidoglycan-binding domain-containing protein [Gemmatimonadaceae bacterium]
MNQRLKMEGSFEAPELAASTPAVRKKRLRLKRRRRRMRPAVRYTLIGAAVVIIGLLVQFAIHTYRTEPRNTSAIAERELRLNTLVDGERVIRMVAVFQRPWIDYFRATRGLLVLTDRRLLFLGLEPRDLLASGDSPPTFTEHDFQVDTAVQLRPGRTFFGIAKALVVDTPDGNYRFGVPSQAWGKASLMLHSIAARHERLVAIGIKQANVRAGIDAQRKLAQQEAAKAKYYTVKRGDALASVAAHWNTTADRLREWNNLPGNKIRIGQTLLVKPQANETVVAGEVGANKR